VEGPRLPLPVTALASSSSQHKYFLIFEAQSLVSVVFEELNPGPSPTRYSIHDQISTELITMGKEASL
jgi:hypothetical protein